MHVVLVTHYFPPIGGPGARRMLGWVNGMTAHGCRVTVVTPEAHPRDPYYQPAERYDGPAEVLTPAVFDPARLARGGADAGDATPRASDATERRGLAARLRPWLLLPDQRRLANGPLVAAALGAIEQSADQPGEGSPDAQPLVLTSSPYNSVHLAGLTLKRKLGDRVAWVADFRDDWFHPVFFPHPNAAYRAYNRCLERQVLRAADGLTVVSTATLEKVRHRHADRFDASFWRIEGDAKWRWMPNGFDPTGVEDVLAAPHTPPADGEPLRVLFSGTLWQGHRLDAFVAALARVAQQTGRRFRFELAGRVIEPLPPTPVSATPAGPTEEPPSVDIVLSGWKPYRESLAATRAADLLLVHTGPESQDIKIKVFDAAAVRRPTLVLGPADSATVCLTREHVPDPLVADQDDQLAIEASLLRWLGSDTPDRHAFAGVPELYDRRRQAVRLVEWAASLGSGRNASSATGGGRA